MRFLADMGISPRCVEWLRTQGHDAAHLYEQGLHKMSDNEVLSKSKNENRILLTVDLDFARLVSKMGSDDLPTVVIFRLSDYRPNHLQARLEILLPVIMLCLENGSSILSVTDDKVRIRKLPII